MAAVITPTARLRPRWIMFGVDVPDGTGVYLYASSTLDVIELQMLATDPVGLLERSQIRKIGPSTEMRNYVMVFGATYADALATLLREWSPDSDEAPALGPQPAIGPP